MIHAKQAKAISTKPVTIEDWIKDAAEKGKSCVTLPFGVTKAEKKELIDNGYEVRKQTSRSGGFRDPETIEVVTNIYWHNA